MTLQDITYQLRNTFVTHPNKKKNYDKAGCRYETPQLSYDDIKTIMERRLAQQKKGLLTDHEMSNIVKDWENQRVEEQLDKKVIAKEVKRPKNKFKEYNVPMLGDTPEKKGHRACRILCCQLNNASTKGMQQIKMDTAQLLNDKYDIDVDVFAELETLNTNQLPQPISRGDRNTDAGTNEPVCTNN